MKSTCGLRSSPVRYPSYKTLKSAHTNSGRAFFTYLFWRTAMKTLVVKDLSMTERMDRQAMARVRGGVDTSDVRYDPYLPIRRGPVYPLPLPVGFPYIPCLGYPP